VYASNRDFWARVEKVPRVRKMYACRVVFVRIKIKEIPIGLGYSNEHDFPLFVSICLFTHTSPICFRMLYFLLNLLHSTIFFFVHSHDFRFRTKVFGVLYVCSYGVIGYFRLPTTKCGRFTELLINCNSMAYTSQCLYLSTTNSTFRNTWTNRTTRFVSVIPRSSLWGVIPVANFTIR